MRKFFEKSIFINKHTMRMWNHVFASILMSQDSQQSSASYNISIILLSKLCSIILIEALYTHYLSQCLSCMRYLMSSEQTRKNKIKIQFMAPPSIPTQGPGSTSWLEFLKIPRIRWLNKLSGFPGRVPVTPVSLPKPIIISLFTQSCQSLDNKVYGHPNYKANSKIKSVIHCHLF